MDNLNQKIKNKSSFMEKTSIKKTESYAIKHINEKNTFSSERKSSQSKESTPVKKKISYSRESTPVKTKSAKISQDVKEIKQKITKEVSKTPVKSKSTILDEVKPKTNIKEDVEYIKIIESQKKTIPFKKISSPEEETSIYKTEIVKRIESPKPSPSPTKLKRTFFNEHIKKFSCTTDKPSFKLYEPERTVQFADRIRSQSVIPSSYNDLAEDGRKSSSPTSLPGSPIRIRCTNGGTKILTSEVFTRTQNHTGSIEVIYRQPYENIKRVVSALKNEGEMSLIDTTDSSLSESVALPSSPSDHEASSDANGRFKSASPISPRNRKSLESIDENGHRISDIITCTGISGQEKGVETAEDISIISLPRKLVMSQYDEMQTTSSTTEASVITQKIEKHSQEERLSPILDVQVVSPPRRKHQFHYEEQKVESTQGNTSSVLTESKAMSSHSMAYRIETLKEVLTLLE